MTRSRVAGGWAAGPEKQDAGFVGRSGVPRRGIGFGWFFVEAEVAEDETRDLNNTRPPCFLKIVCHTNQKRVATTAVHPIFAAV